MTNKKISMFMFSTFLFLLNAILMGLFSVILMMNSAQASILGWRLLNPFLHHVQSTKIDTNSEYHKRLPLMFIDDLTQDQNIKKLVLTKAQKHQALVWGLNEQQEKRYVLLMQNRSGFYYHNRKLSPVEILGINARTDQERALYARLDARQEFEKNAKLLAFNAAYHRAALQLKKQLKLPIILPFNYEKYSPYHYEPIHFKNHDKFMLFIKATDHVKPIVSYFMTKISEKQPIQLNIYFVGKKVTRKIVTQWAKAQNIPPKWVNEKHITLNLDYRQYKKINAGSKDNKKTPMLILIRDGKSHVVDTSKF